MICYQKQELAAVSCLFLLLYGCLDTLQLHKIASKLHTGLRVEQQIKLNSLTMLTMVESELRTGVTKTLSELLRQVLT